MFLDVDDTGRAPPVRWHCAQAPVADGGVAVLPSGRYATYSHSPFRSSPVIDTKPSFLTHHKNGREIDWYKTPLIVEDGFASGILLHRIALKQNDRAIRKIEHLS